MLKNNTVGLAKAAKIFSSPSIITTVETKSFSGYTYPELLSVFPEAPILECTSMNSWDDQKVCDALKKNARKKVIVSGPWIEVCNNTFACARCWKAATRFTWWQMRRAAQARRLTATPCNA